MKRICILLSLLLVGVIFVSAGGPDVGAFGIGGDNDEAIKDFEVVEKAIGDYSPLDESGEVDYKKYKPFVTKAEMRIVAINSWLDANVGWMRYIFHMKPAISFLFFINVYIILWFFVVLFLNAEGLWFFIKKKGNARIFGFGVFFILLVVKFYYGIASVIYNLGLTLFWLIILFVIMYFGIAVIKRIFDAFIKHKATKKAMKEKMEMKTSIEVVDELVKQVGKQR
jgi:hypothetical protein